MAYLGRRGAVAPLSSSDIPAGIVEGTDIAFLENASGTQNLGGTYSTERMYLNDSYTLTGDVTVTGHLSLGTVADADVVITNDSTARILTGGTAGGATGTLEAGVLIQSEKTSLTGMVGELGSVVTGSPAITGFGTVTSGTLGSGVTFPAGHVLQVKSTTVTGTPSVTSSGTWIDWTGLTVTITPSSSSHKILITASVNTSAGSDSAQRICRKIGLPTDNNSEAEGAVGIGDTRGSRTRSTTGGNVHRGDHEMQQYSVNFLDSPNTTEATIYKLQCRDEDGDVIYLNREKTDASEAQDSTGISTITVMEVVA